ncbi:MAG: hypothetical protein K5694_01980 [Bacilli bacterium]|nr:hypothetical protein [Bacilli bacterium]
MKKKFNVKDFENIEEEFFDLDKENKIVKVSLKYPEPSAIFYMNCLSKIPVFTDEFKEWLTSLFLDLPRSYKLDLSLIFDDMKGYSEENLRFAFRKNVILSMKEARKAARFRDKLAVLLILIGFFFFAALIVGKFFWQGDDILHNAVFYIIDIATMVLFWEAASILIIENYERRLRYYNYRDRFHGVSFLEEPKEENK